MLPRKLRCLFLDISGTTAGIPRSTKRYGRANGAGSSSQMWRLGRCPFPNVGSDPVRRDCLGSNWHWFGAVIPTGFPQFPSPDSCEVLGRREARQGWNP